jgi:hypothetical protein
MTPSVDQTMPLAGNRSLAATLTTLGLAAATAAAMSSDKLDRTFDIV